MSEADDATAQAVESWPRTIQANLHRFYERIILPAMKGAPVHPKLMTGEAPTMDEFLDRAAAQVDNYTANEANKVYALVLIALFERYLRLWAAQILAGTGVKTRYGDLIALIDAVAEKAGIDLVGHDLRATLQEALIVGNAVRHGEGSSLDKVRTSAAHLIDRSKRDYIDLIAQETPDSEWLCIRPRDIERYVAAMIRFWGLADKLPMAVTSYTLNG